MEELRKRGDEVQDLGPEGKASVDYPDYAERVGEAVVSGKVDRGILICCSGLGMSIAANKVKGIRAALVESVESARLSRLHNDANILCLSALRTSEDTAREIVKVWLETGFEGGRHQRRVEKIGELEKS